MNIYDCAVAEIDVSYSQRVSAKDRIKITGSEDAYKTCTLFWPSYDHIEYFYILLLNRNNQVLGSYQVSKGGFTGTVVDVRVIFQVALKTCACSLIAIHNHPSGNLTASDADIQLTKSIKDCGKFLNIELLDHLIISSESFHSMADSGEL